MKVLICFEGRVRPDSTGFYFLPAFKNLGHDVTHITPDQIHAVKGGYDLYVRVDDGIYAPWPSHLHPSAYYVIDTHLDTEWRLKLEKEGKFDHVSVAQKPGLSLPWSTKNVSWNPLGCDPDAHNVGAREKLYDVGFIGHFHSQYAKKRMDMLGVAFAAATGKVYYGNRQFKEMAEKYAQSKIVFNWSLNKDINMRVFEAMASGSCLLTDRIPEMAEIGLVDGTHFVGYADEKELAEAVKFLLHNDATRERIAQAGQLEALRSHTYQDRAALICKVMEEQKCLST